MGDLRLTCELKGNLQPLRCLANLKAKDLKTFLLYLAPIILRPFLSTTNADSGLDDRNSVMQALRDLLEESDFLGKCERVIEKFPQK